MVIYINQKQIRTAWGLTVAVAFCVALLLQIRVAQAANTFPGVNSLININTSGDGGTNMGLGGNAHGKGITADGNIVLFTSTQTDIQSADGSGRAGLYQRNLATNTTVRVDVSASGVGGNGFDDGNARMSETGRYVVFSGGSTNLIDGVTVPPGGTVYFKDMQTGTVTSLLTDSSGQPVAGPVNPLKVSNDGRFVLFSTNQTGTVIPGMRNGYQDLVMLDVPTHTWTLVDTPASGGLQSVDTGVDRLGMSCDGEFVVFYSGATNLVSGYSGSGTHIFLADLRNGLKITDMTAGGTVGSAAPAISCNGRYVTFATKDRNVVSPTPAGLDANYHLVEYDRYTGDAKYVDSDSSGAYSSSISATTTNVSNTGDVILTRLQTVGFATYATLNLKHISDGSGTLENVEKKAGGGYLTLVNANLTDAEISANSKYVIYDTRDAYDLGLASTQTCNTNPSSAHDSCDVVRSKTGL